MDIYDYFEDNSQISASCKSIGENPNDFDNFIAQLKTIIWSCRHERLKTAILETILDEDCDSIGEKIKELFYILEPWKEISLEKLVYRIDNDQVVIEYNKPDEKELLYEYYHNGQFTA